MANRKVPLKERKKGPLPELPINPLEVLENFDSMLNRFQQTVGLIDGKLGQIDKATTELDKRFTLPTGFVPKTKPKPHTHLSYEGQSKVDYCQECLSKHGQTAKVLMREALQRAKAGSPSDSGVLEKVRGAVEELVGFEDDSDTVENEKVSTLNSAARDLRKLIYAKGAEVGTANLEDLREIKGMIDKLVDVTYQVRASEECVGCTVEELCGGNLECVEFIEKAAKTVKDPAEFRKILRQAREKYRRGGNV